MHGFLQGTSRNLRQKFFCMLGLNEGKRTYSKEFSFAPENFLYAGTK
jgi:hypothetical protein